MNSVGPQVLIQWLRAAGEPTRLRLLSLTADSALSVSDLAHAVRQSEPRVSRHLKILSEAGLIVRVRQGQWVHYRITDGAEALSFVRGLLGQLDRTDPVLIRDRSGARAAAHPDSQAGGGESRLGRALAALVAGGLDGVAGAVLVMGVAHPELLEVASRSGRTCTAIAPSRRAAQGARAFAERRGFSCWVLQAAAPGVVTEADLARAGASFAAVLLDHPVSGEAHARLLERAGRALAAGGRLWVFERYEALENSRERVVEHPLARLRRLLSEAGLACERVSPVEADGEHVLAALARAAAVPGRAAGSGP